VLRPTSLLRSEMMRFSISVILVFCCTAASIDYQLLHGVFNITAAEHETVLLVELPGCQNPYMLNEDVHMEWIMNEWKNQVIDSQIRFNKSELNKITQTEPMEGICVDVPGSIIPEDIESLDFNSLMKCFQNLHIDFVNAIVYGTICLRDIAIDVVNVIVFLTICAGYIGYIVMTLLPIKHKPRAKKTQRIKEKQSWDNLYTMNLLIIMFSVSVLTLQIDVHHDVDMEGTFGASSVFGITSIAANSTTIGVANLLAGKLYFNTNAFADGQGTDATFNSPGGMVLDSVGRIIVADGANSLIRVVTTGGI